MSNKLFQNLKYLIIFLICWSCQNSPKPHHAVSDDTPVISFERFEEIAENQPEKYISNPDSFLQAINLNPKDAYEKEVYAYGITLIAYNLREQGNIFNSIQYYEKALNYIKTNNVENIDISLYILKPLATLYINVDDNKKAITLLEDLLNKTKDDQQFGLANNLANAYIYNGEPKKAIKLVTQKVENLNLSLTKALLLNTLSTAYRMVEDSLNSSKNNKLALNTFEKFRLNHDTLIWYCSALTQYSALNKSTKEVSEALEILNTNFPHTQFRAKANAYLSLAEIHFENDNISVARDNYYAAFQHFQQEKQKYVFDYKYTYALLGLARCFRENNQLDSAILYYEWAIENDFRTQQLITSELDQLRNNVWNKQIVEELINLFKDHPKIQTQSNTKTLLWCIELSKARLLINEINRSENWNASDQKIKDELSSIRLLYQRYDASQSAVEKKAISTQIDKLKTDFQLEESYFETINFNPSKSSFLNKINGKNDAFYSYYIQKDKSISIVFTNTETLEFKNISDTSLIANLKQFKSNYFSNSPNLFNNNPQQYIDAATQFGKLLLPALNTSKKNVFVSLDGELYGLPFDALYDQDYLIKNHNFAYLNSFLLFDFITNKSTTNTNEISLLHRSHFPYPLPSLAFVDNEVENLTKKFETLALAPSDQNDSTIRDAFSRTNIIHIAAHTILDSLAPPYLYLHQAISTNQLRFFEIKTPLVFLSACNTGSGRPLPSEGTESIQRVFMSKNVPSVISTYWFANDEVMLYLTSSFYDELKESNSPMNALAQAKREFLNQASNQQLNPWYWANINYTGIDNKVGLKNSSNLPLAIMGLTIFILSIYLGYKFYLGRIKYSKR